MKENGKGNGLPVFVTPEENPSCDLKPIMTLRQWYAGMAMQGLLCGLSHPDASLSFKEKIKSLGMSSAQELASLLSFNYADAMITFEEKENEQ